MAITIEMIKDLRDRTGVGMAKCKEALAEANGDIETAIANLRKAGMASAVKKEGRAANEGMISSASNDQAVVLVEVNAETDFVVKNERFQEFLKEIAGEALQAQPKTIEEFLAGKYSKDNSLTIDEYRATLVQALGENIVISRVVTLPKNGQKSIGVYSHLGGKILTMVEITGNAEQEQLASDIAMHVAAASPDFLSPETIPTDVVDHEKEIAKGQMQGKPEHIMDKIIDGKLKAFYKDNCLVCQQYIRDDSKTIQELVETKAKETGKPLSISTFLRWTVGS